MLIFSLGSQSDRPLLFTLAINLFVFITTNPVLGTPWELTHELREKLNLGDLKERFPEINSADELSEFLIELSRIQPFFSLDAQLHNQTWVISGEPAEFVADIRISLITSRLEKAMEVVRQKYLGRVDSPSVRRRVTDSILNILSEYGYLLADVNFQLESTDKGKTYRIDIDEGEPCVIKKITFPFALPDNVKFAAKPGDLCDVDFLSTSIDTLEDSLLNMGYRDLRINLDTISYSKDGREAEVFIKGVIGKRIIYKIIDQSKLFFIDDIFAGRDLEHSDIQLASPDSMFAELNKFYRSKGYEDVKISEPEIKNIGKNQEEYTYYIDPGKQYLVTKIEFEGHRYFTQSEMKEAMNVTSFWDTSVILSRDEFNQGTGALEAKYQKAGFWDVKIPDPRITKDPNTATAQMIIGITEGPQRIFDSVEIRGNNFFPTPDFEDLIEFERGDHLDKSVLLDLQDQIRNLYLAKGFHYVDVSISIQSAPGKNQLPTKVIITIDEGIRVKIGRINIIGLIKTRSQVVRRELLFEPGDWYNPEVINKSRVALMNLGFFRSVQITPTDRVAFLDKAPVLNVTVEAYEGNAGSVSFGPGYNYNKGFHYSSEFTYQNLWGTGRQVSLKASISEEKEQNAISNRGDSKGKIFLGRKLAAGFVEPWLFDFPVNGHVAVSHKGVADEIWHLSNVFDLSLSYVSKDFIPGSVWIPFYNFKFNKEEGSSTHDQSLVSTGYSRIASIGLRYRLDRRNDLSWPSKGDLIQWELSYARPGFGGEYHFLKWETSYKHFFGLGDRFVWSNGFSTGGFEGVERKNTDQGVLPYSERYQVGGVSTVRGFEQKLGPWVSSEEAGSGPQTTGGSHRTLLRTELRYKITDYYAASLFIDSGNTYFTGSEEDRISQIFADAGNTRQLRDNLPNHPGQLLGNPKSIGSKHYNSFGISASVITPVGPINGYLAWPISEPTLKGCDENQSCFIRRKERDPWIQKFQFYINIGTDF